MNEAATRAEQLTLVTTLVGLLVGGTALWLGLSEGAIAFWGFGAACLLQVPPALSLRGRIRDGLGNSGLERERLTLRTVSFLLRFLALGMGMAAASALLGQRAPQISLAMQGLAALSVVALVPLWFAKQALRAAHATFDLDAARTLVLLELAALLLVGTILAHWFPWADAVGGLAQALWVFFAGQTLAKATALPPTRGCGGSCSCG